MQQKLKEALAAVLPVMAIVFSLPVTDTAGMRFMDELEEETE